MIARIVALLLIAPAALAGPCDALFHFDGDLADSGDNGYNGTMIGKAGAAASPRFVTGRYGQALSLDGTSAMRAFADLHWETCPQVTIVAWVNVAALATTTQYLVSTGSGSGPGLRFAGNTLFAHGTANGLMRSNAIRNNAGWMLVAGTWNYDTGRYSLHWRNRVIVTELTENRRPPENALWVGALNDGISSPAKGVLIDELRIYGRVLSDEEIRALQKTGTRTGLTPALPQAVPGFTPPVGATGFNVDPANLPDRPPELTSQGGDPLLEAPAVPDPNLANLEAPQDLPGQTLQEEIDATLAAAQENFDEQSRENYEKWFGPNDRAQVAFGDNWQIAYVSAPGGIATGPGHLPDMTLKLQGWLGTGLKIQEIFRIAGSGRIVAVADDGSLAYYDSRPPTRGYGVIGTLAGMANPDVVADQMGDYLVISGTQVRASGAPQGAVDWVEAEIADQVQVTALALLNGDAWIGVSNRAVGSGGMSPTHWGQGLLADVQRFVAAGERIEDIAAGTGSVSDKWMIATDKRVFIRGVEDCRKLKSFGDSVEANTGRQWDCYYEPRNCLANRDTWTLEDMASPPDPNVWEVNVLVTIGVTIYDQSPEDKDDFGCWLEDALQRAELLYNDTPRLKIKLRTQRSERVGGYDLDNFVMHSDSDYKAYMDEHFDIMAKSRTEGYFPVLISRRVCIGYDDDGTRHCIGGRARFPHTVSPFERKFGIIMKYPDSRDHVLALEFGHYFGLIHTFQRTSPFSTALECNWDYLIDGVDEPKCGSCRNGIVNSTTESCSGDFNVMDYCGGANDRVYLNGCQQNRAVDQRNRYLTNPGQTDYFKMKGRQGEPYCSDDGDCLDDEYCNTGVATIGRNVCKSLLSDGAACSRSGQCESGNCSLFSCRAN